MKPRPLQMQQSKLTSSWSPAKREFTSAACKQLQGLCRSHRGSSRLSRKTNQGRVRAWALIHNCLHWLILSTLSGKVLTCSKLLSPTQCLGTLKRLAQTLDFPKQAVCTRLLCFGEKRSMDLNQAVPLHLRASAPSLDFSYLTAELGWLILYGT